MLVAEHYQLIPADEHAACEACGVDTRDGAGRRYVSFNVGAGPGDDPVIAPGLILTTEDQPQQRIIQHRDPTTGRVTNTVVPKKVLCEDCITYPARMLGMEDRSEIRAQLEDASRVIAERDQEIAKLQTSVARLEAAVKGMEAFGAVLDLARRPDEAGRERGAALMPKPAPKKPASKMRTSKRRSSAGGKAS